MITLLPAAQRQRTSYFDRFVDSGIEVLDNPEIASQIGGFVDVATSKRILAEAVLPNYRYGILSVPKEYREDDTTLILPLKNCKSYLAYQALSISVIWQGSEFGNMHASPQYSRTYNHDFSQGSFADNEAAKAPKMMPDGITVFAGATCLTFLRDDRCSRSRPWITISKELFLEPTSVIGNLAVHETVHVQDLLVEAGTYTSSRLYKAASELRAYKAVAEIEAINGEKMTFAQKLEAKRQEEKGNDSFIPTQALYRWMVEGGYTG